MRIPTELVLPHLHALNSEYQRMYSEISDAVREPDINGLWFDAGSVVATRFKGANYQNGRKVGDELGHRYEEATKKNSVFLAWCTEWTEYYIAKEEWRWPDARPVDPMDDQFHMCPPRIVSAIEKIEAAALVEARKLDPQGELAWVDNQDAKVIPLPFAKGG